MKKDNGVACALAWTSLGMNTWGTIRPCGRSSPNRLNPNLNHMTTDEAWNSTFYKKLRLDMLNGIKNSNCQKCYVQEELKATKSKRQDTNEHVKFDMDYWKNKTNEDGSVDFAPTHIDVRVGNICNLKCVHCWTGNSSKWFEDKAMLNKYENTSSKKPHKDFIDKDGDIWTYIKDNADQITKLSFLGGEPLASKEHNQLLKWLYENNKTHIELYYVTNGTLLDKQKVDWLKAFRRCTLGISLDATHKVAELLRFPTKWATVEKHLDYLNTQVTFDPRIDYWKDEKLTENKKYSEGFETYFNWTAYNTNIWHLPETYKYCTERWKNIDFRLADWVQTPRHMALENLPWDFKAKVIEKFKTCNIPNQQFYLNVMIEKDYWEELGDTFYEYLEDLDLARKTNWRKVLPEIAEIWQK